MRRIIDIKLVEQYYTVTEDGMLWSRTKGRWMKPQRNASGYVFYFLVYGVDKPCWVFAHTLVALKYIGEPPSLKHEIDHIDDSRVNNHYSNLRWVTHSENVKKGFDNGRVGWWLGKSREAYHVGLETRMKMSNAKKKRIKFDGDDGKVIYYDSIEDASKGLKTYRKRVYLSIRDGVAFGGGLLSVVDEVGV